LIYLHVLHLEFLGKPGVYSLNLYLISIVYDYQMYSCPHSSCYVPSPSHPPPFYLHGNIRWSY
jgi:hypothetical protein